MNRNTVPMFVRTDTYKASHFKMYPEAKKMVAYGEFREPFGQDHRIVFYGMNYIIDKYLNRQWTHEELIEAEKFYSNHNAGQTSYPFPKDLFESFIEENNGYFPVKIEAMPEGSVIYPHIPVYQITAEGKYSRLVTFLETLLTQVWYPTNVATLSRHTREVIEKEFDKTVDDDSRWLLASRLHDFGYRGCTTDEQAMIGGSAHLLNFDGTDTMVAAHYAHSLNNGKPFASSIPATEHSVMTSWPSELEAVENMIENFGSGVFACVADSYDYDNFLHTVLPAVAEKVKAKGGVMVIRPDSGDPVECVIKGLEACEKYFGCTVNKKGYKVLNNSAVIQGDGIDKHIVMEILWATTSAGFSAQNVAFGMGAGLLHKHNRDTMSFATKLSYIQYANGEERNVMKMPKTDMSKASMPGVLQVINIDDCPVVYPAEMDAGGQNLLEVYYNNGPVERNRLTFEELRNKVDVEWRKRNSSPRRDVHSSAIKNKMEVVFAERR